MEVALDRASCRFDGPSTGRVSALVALADGSRLGIKEVPFTLSDDRYDVEFAFLQMSGPLMGLIEEVLSDVVRTCESCANRTETCAKAATVFADPDTGAACCASHKPDILRIMGEIKGSLPSL